MKRCALILVVTGIAGCSGGPFGRSGATDTSGRDRAGEVPDPFIDHEPLVPADEPQLPPYPTPATANEGTRVTIVPEIERGEVPQLQTAAPKITETWRESLETIARKLKLYVDREPGSLTNFARLQLLQLKREALLLLLISGRFDSEECRLILDVFKKHEFTNLELEGLKFVLYQRLGETEKRTECLEYLERETRGTLQFRLEGVCFCEKAVGYRAVVPVRRSVFRPGAYVQIYGEFSGAATRSTPAGYLEQQIQVYLTLLYEAGTTVDTVELLSRSDGTRRLSSNEQPDTKSYFLGTYRLPQSLAPGTYQLRLAATDLVGQTEAHAVLSFKVER